MVMLFDLCALFLILVCMHQDNAKHLIQSTKHKEAGLSIAMTFLTYLSPRSSS